MSLKQKVWRFGQELLQALGIGLALLGVGALVFQDIVESGLLMVGVVFIVLGVLMVALSLVALLLEGIMFEE